MAVPNLLGFADEVRGIIHQMINLYNEADREEKSCCNLSVSQCCTLLAFDSIDEQLTMNQLSSRLDLSTSTMTRHVDRLVHKGHAERAPSEQDRRRVIVQLTESGKEMAETLRNCEQNLFSEVLQSIPPDQWGTVVSTLKLLVNAIQARKSDCC